MTIPYLAGALAITAFLFVNRNRRLHYLAVGVFLVLQWSLTFYAFNHQDISEFGYFTPDSLAILLLFTLSIIAIPAFLHSFTYLTTMGDTPRKRGIYLSAMVMLVAALSAAYLSNHIAVTWIFVELTTLASSALIYHPRNIRSLEGTWKYIFICSISISLVFIGILFLSIALQKEGISDLSYPALLQNAASLNVFWLRLAFIFIFTGYTAKLGLVPMFTAGIDAKDKAPSPAGALFSSVLMNVGFVGVFRFYEIIAFTALHTWANTIIMLAATLSVFVATVYMLRVKNIKRIMAYSGVEHMGIVMIGIAAGGIGYYAAILHIVFHAFVKSSMFFQMGQIYRIYNSKSIYDTGNYLKYNLTGAIVMLLAFVCTTAMPPSGLFISEFMIFLSLFESHQFFVLILLLLLLTTIMWAFGKNIFKLVFSIPVKFDEILVERIKPYESYSQFILLGLVFYLGLNPPQQMVDLINGVIAHLP